MVRDLERLDWLEESGWIMDVFVDEDLFSPWADPSPRLQAGLFTARRRSGLWVPQGHYLHL